MNKHVDLEPLSPSDHEGLLTVAETLFETTRAVWAKECAISTYALSWSPDPYCTDLWRSRYRIVFMRLFEKDGTDVLQDFVERTKACGLMLVEQEKDKIVGTFETRHGARQWEIPFEQNGNQTTLGNTKARDNQGCLGLLWVPRKGQA